MNTAADVMTKQVVILSPMHRVADAIDKMKEKNVSSLLVRPGEGMHTWGFMTETDVIEKVVAMGLEPESGPCP